MPQTKQPSAALRACAAIDQGHSATEYAVGGLAEHKTASHLPTWHRAFTGPALDKTELAERLHELEAHSKLGLAAQQAVSAAAAALNAFFESLNYEDTHGLAEHKDAAGKHLGAWHAAFRGVAVDKQEMAERLHELEAHVRLGKAASEALEAAAAAVKAYNLSMGYDEEHGLAEHKDAAGKHLPTWHRAFTGPALDKAELAERLHELEAHVKLGLVAKEELSKAAAAAKAYSEGWGYCEDLGVAQHKEGDLHLAVWHKSYAPSLDKEEMASRLADLKAAHAAIAKAAAAVQAWGEGWDYEDVHGLAEHKDNKGHLPLWHQKFNAAVPKADLAERMAELGSHSKLGLVN